MDPVATVDASRAGLGAPALDLQNLVYGYERPVAGPLDLCLRRGQRVGVHGPTGAGKSTLLRAILGRARVHSGTMTVHTLPIAYQPQVQIRLAQMPWTGREHLDFVGATVTGLPCALTSELDHRVDRLSGGQYQLLGIWAALAGPAALVLLDEPTSYLDPGITDAVAQSLLGLDATKAALVVSHDRDFLEQTCTELIRVASLQPARPPYG